MNGFDQAQDQKQKQLWTGVGPSHGRSPKPYTRSIVRRCVITMAEPFSIERRKLMRFMGAKASAKVASIAFFPAIFPHVGSA